MIRFQLADVDIVSYCIVFVLATEPGLAARLAKARERAGFSQDEVALLLGQPRPVISNWENGSRSPNSAQLAKLASIYRIPLSQLLGQEQEPRPSLELLMFREAADRLDARAKFEIQRFLAFLDEYGDFLERGGDSPGLTSSPFGVSAGFGTKEDIRRKAEQARHWLGLGDGPVGDLLYIADLAGIAVYMGALGADLHSTVSGAFVPHQRVGFAVLLNAQTTPGRRQYTLAHEVAHALFHGDHPYVGYLRKSDAAERFADLFAAEFLVPTNSLRAYVERLSPRDVNDPEFVVELQRLFQVSYATMLVRLRTAGLIKEEDLQALRKERPVRIAQELGYPIAEDEWRQDPETWGLRRFPHRFVRLLRQRLLRDQITISRAASITGLAEEDIEELLRLGQPDQTEAREFDLIRASA